MFFLLLLSVPNALGNKAEFDLPLASPLFSLFFYLTCLVLAAVHVIVCTSSENTCFFCSISWVLAIGIMVLVSALFCIILSIFGKMILRLKPSNEVSKITEVKWYVFYLYATTLCTHCSVSQICWSWFNDHWCNITSSLIENGQNKFVCCIFLDIHHKNKNS